MVWGELPISTWTLCRVETVPKSPLLNWAHSGAMEFHSLSIYLSVYIYIYISICIYPLYLSTISVFTYICMSIYLSIYLSVCLTA